MCFEVNISSDLLVTMPDERGLVTGRAFVYAYIYPQLI